MCCYRKLCSYSTLLVNSRGWSLLRVVFSQTRNFTVIAFTGWIYCIEIFFTLPWKKVCREIVHCIEYIFYHSGFLSNLPLPWKQSLSWIHCIECIFFIIQYFWATCPFHEKQRVPWIHCIEYIFFIIQDFWATCACLEKQSCPDIFHCIEIFFIIQDFWATCACPENRGYPEFTVLNVYFLSFRIFEQLALALKTESALKFFRTGGRPPPPTPRLVRLCACLMKWSFLSGENNKQTKKRTGPLNPQFPTTNRRQKVFIGGFAFLRWGYRFV